MDLTPDQLKHLDDQGCLRVPQFVDVDEALRIRSILENLFTRRAGENEGAYGELAADASDEKPNSPQIILPVNYAPELHKTECFKRAQRYAKQILGPNAAFTLDLAISKKAGGGEATPWHQDLAFRDPNFKYNEVTIWIALQEVDEESGCLMFLPATHRADVLEHRRVNREGKSVALECVGEFDRASAIAGSLPLGGCTIHFPGTLHSSTPNRSKSQRITYIMTFGVPPVPSDRPMTFPWREDGASAMQLQRRRWMRKGGAVVTLWRRVRRGDVRSWRSLLYLTSRAIKTISTGK